MRQTADQQADDLALIESAALHSIYERDGTAGFDRASSRILFNICATILHVSGSAHLNRLLRSFKEAQKQRGRLS